MLFPCVPPHIYRHEEQQGCSAMAVDHQSEAVQAVLAEMARQSRTTMQVARLAGIDPGTMGDFLAGARWPKPGTQGRIEQALGWEYGEINRIGTQGGEPRKIGAVGGDSDTDDEILFHIPATALEGLSEADREEVIATAKAAAYRALREIRGS